MHPMREGWLALAYPHRLHWIPEQGSQQGPFTGTGMAIKTPETTMPAAANVVCSREA